MKTDGVQIIKNTEKLQGLEICMKVVQTEIKYMKGNQETMLSNQGKLETKFDDFINAIHEQRLQDIEHNEDTYAKNKDVDKLNIELSVVNKWVVKQKVKTAYIAGGALIIWFFIQYVLIPLLTK